MEIMLGEPFIATHMDAIAAFKFLFLISNVDILDAECLAGADGRIEIVFVMNVFECERDPASSSLENLSLIHI